MASGSNEKFADVGLVLPKSVVLDSSGGAWVDRNGKLVGGKGGGEQQAQGETGGNRTQGWHGRSPMFGGWKGGRGMARPCPAGLAMRPVRFREL